MGAFGSDSNTSDRTYTVGNLTASEGSTTISLIGGRGNVLPGATQYKIGRGGAVNLSVTSSGVPSTSGTYLAGAIEEQAAAALRSYSPGTSLPGGVNKKTLLIGAAVVAVLFVLLFFFKR